MRIDYDVDLGPNGQTVGTHYVLTESAAFKQMLPAFLADPTLRGPGGWLVQTKHPDAKPLRGFHGAGVLEVVEDDNGSTFRAVYTVKFAGVVYVLHAFQKKSKRGAKTPAEEIDKVKARLKEAEKHHAEWSAKQEKDDQGHH